jgi:DtxR family transcriptional regulator, Mn-dependent transcriptional regulator
MSNVELSASQEDYLEMIYFLESESGKARPKDIAERMHVRAASVTGALRALAEKEMIHYLPYGSATLTDEGREIALQIAGKHAALLTFFTQVLGIERDDAEEFACSMEHTIPDHILQRFIQFANYAKKCPGFNASWQEAAKGYFCRAEGLQEERCGNCELCEPE